ncbi:MAG TPA: hypothetical protein VM055_06360 [Novosphingobium sp.]|nr:hypothetical protein [Novosphingobium sp.]
MTGEGFARRMFRWAAIYGVLVVAPLYLLPPPAPKSEAYYYGFVGAALAFQGLYWIIGGDPLRYRALMPLGMIGKLSFAIPALTLFALGPLDALTAIPVSIDVLLALGFAAAWAKTRRVDGAVAT